MAGEVVALCLLKTHSVRTGNMDTLGVTPSSQGVDIRDAMMKFYYTHYSANLMKLVVVGRGQLMIPDPSPFLFPSRGTPHEKFCDPGSPILCLFPCVLSESLDDLEKMVHTFFSEVPDRKLSPLSTPLEVLVFCLAPPCIFTAQDSHFHRLKSPPLFCASVQQVFPEDLHQVSGSAL